MCGIVGVRGAAPAVDDMVAALAHRGPDGQGTFIDDGIALGAARLAIVDPDGGAQPMANEDGTVRLVFNGEVYNHDDLRERLASRGHRFSSTSDTEVIVHAYEEWGDGFLQRLDGMFAVALWDSEADRLLLARDRFGRKPLYYARQDGAVLFASEIKALLRHPAIDPQVRPAALHPYFAYGHVPGRETLFDGIRRVPPGHLLVHDGTDITARCHARFTPSPDPSLSLDAAADMLRDAVQHSVERRVPPGEQPTVFLSGGIDSSLIVGALDRAGVTPATITAGIGEAFDETGRARLVADHYATDHDTVRITDDDLSRLPAAVYHFDQPVSDPAAIPTSRLAERAQGKVVMTGTGGDELFGGYEHYRIMQQGDRVLRPLPSRLRTLIGAAVERVPARLLDRLFPYASDLGDAGMDRFRRYIDRLDDPAAAYRAIVTLFAAAERDHLLTGDPADRAPAATDPFFDRADVPRAAMLAETRTALPANLLMKADRMAMMHGREARTPLLGRDVAAVASRIPTRHAVGRTPKRVLRRAAAGILPGRVRDRPKQRMFVPVHTWLQDRAAFRETVLDIPEPHLDDRAVDRIVSRFDRSPLYRARQLWAVMTFKLWHRTFIDGETQGVVDIDA